MARLNIGGGLPLGGVDLNSLLEGRRWVFCLRAGCAGPVLLGGFGNSITTLKALETARVDVEEGSRVGLVCGMENGVLWSSRWDPEGEHPRIAGGMI